MPTEKPTFEELVQEHAPFVRRTLAQLGVSARDLADVEQEVFRGADRGLPAFDPSLSCNPDTAVRGWLFGICERQAASHRRAEIKRGEVLFATEELDYAASAAPSVEERLIEHERKELLQKLLEALEPHRRAVVVAYELEGVAMADVAAALSIPVNTAWNRLRLGREDLRAAWKRMARKGVRGAPMLPLAALFGGAAWCSEASAATGSISSGPTGDLASGATGHLSAAQGGVSAASLGGAIPSVVIAPAQATVFGAMALGVPLAVTAMLVLGAGEEPPALPETERPAAAVAWAPGVTPALAMSARDVRQSFSGDVRQSFPGDVWQSFPRDVWQSFPRDVWQSFPGDVRQSFPGDVWQSFPRGGSPDVLRAPASGAPVLAAGRGGALYVSEADADNDAQPAAGGRAGQSVPTGGGGAPAMESAGPLAAPPGGKGAAHGNRELKRELQQVGRAAKALEGGDFQAAQEALDAHERRYNEGRLAAERELLQVRLLLAQGLRNEARDRARAFLAKHPGTPFRGELERLASPK